MRWSAPLGDPALGAHHRPYVLAPSETSTMYPANAYVIRYATVDDVPALRRLVELDSPRLFCGPALIGEIGGAPAAAVSLADGRVIADPSQPTSVLRQLLRMRRDALRAHFHASSLAERLRAALGTVPARRANPETKAYIERKRAEGKTNRDAIRCLKRHLARRIWHLLQPPPPVLNNSPNINLLTYAEPRTAA
jgi:hypothetical protein